MDAATRRRELRRRKILQNAEDRIKKLTGVADVKRENVEKQQDFSNDSVLKLLKNCSTEVDLNFETTYSAITTPREKLIRENSLVHQDEPTEMQNKTDDYVRKERVDKTYEQQTDKTFADQTTVHSIKEKLLNENVSTVHQNEPTQMDGCATRKILDEINQHQIDETVAESNTEPEAVFSKVFSVRPVIVMILAMFCFTKFIYFPAIYWLLDSLWFLEIYNEKEFSFIIPFCILEIVLFFTPSIRKRENTNENIQKHYRVHKAVVAIFWQTFSPVDCKVTPGKQVKIWLLALKLCGVSPKIVDAAKIIILEILEFLTDLAMFIFVLVILQNVKELYVQNVLHK